MTTPKNIRKSECCYNCKHSECLSVYDQVFKCVLYDDSLRMDIEKVCDSFEMENEDELPKMPNM